MGMTDPSIASLYRHRFPVRLMHWINALCLLVLLMSGAQIFNAHPALYWGQDSRFDASVLSMTAEPRPDGRLRGVTGIGRYRFDTTGVFGASKNMRGELSRRGFPMWATLPGPRSLAAGRRWHFFFAWVFAINGAAYLLWSWRSRHFRNDLAPTRSDWRGIGRSIVDHLRFKHPSGEAATRYNILQKLAYLAVILIFGPGIFMMGLAMSPSLGPVLGWMIDLVGGRQSARTIHFIIAVAFIGFIAVHLTMVAVSGPFNQIRSMITGWYRIANATPAANEGNGHAGQ